VTTDSALRGSTPPAGAQPTVRRVIVYVLLFALVTIAATGVGGLLGFVFDTGTALADGGTAGLASWLANTLVGGPLAAVLWWFVWKRLADPAERRSIAWGFYLTAMTSTALITAVTALLITVALLVENTWQPTSAATGIVWAAVWAWHRWMLRHPLKKPVRLVTVPGVFGWVFGLLIGVGGAVAALGSLVDTAVTGSTAISSFGSPWWYFSVQALVWAVGGAVVWWWHWVRTGGRATSTRFFEVALISVGILGASLLTLGGLGTMLFVGLRLAFDRTDPMNDLLGPLGYAFAAASIGGLVWNFHHRITRQGSATVRQSDLLVTSGVALVAAATGLGVIVNAALATLSTSLAGGDTRTLLMAGISSLLVGAPIWWIVWRPSRQDNPGVSGPSRSESAARRIYLVAVFGLSAVVALITLLVIGYRVFDFALNQLSGGSLIDQIRAPLGLLVATGLVAGYHFSVWRHDHALQAAAEPARARTIDQVILVTEAPDDTVKHLIEDLTGATVIVWVRAGAATAPVSASSASASASAAQLITEALAGVTGSRVLVISGPGSFVDVIPLAE
jgi:hypothetical protein